MSANVNRFKTEDCSWFGRPLSIIQGLVFARTQRRSLELADLYEQCQQLMSKGDCEPYAFERAAVLLRKARRYDDEVRLCNYVREWAEWREAHYAFGARTWLNSRYKRVIARQARAEALAGRAQGAAGSR